MPLTIETIDLILPECLELVEKFQYSGPNKKVHVINIVKEKNPSEKEMKAACMVSLVNFLDG